MALTDTGPVARADRSMAGFTLLELLVVIVIIGLLAAYVGPRYFSQLANSQRQSAQVQLEGLARALQFYRLDTGRYPSTEQGLEALVRPPGETQHWSGPYLQKAVPLDPWGHAYVYRLNGAGAAAPATGKDAALTGGDFELLSHGKDGRPGGSGEDADVRYQGGT
jgi:general secretion pathway protein G